MIYEITFILLSLNSYLVFFDNLIIFHNKEKFEKKIFEFNLEDEMIIKSITTSFIIFIIELFIILYINKKLLLIILLYIIFVHLITIIIKHKNMNLFFKLNHLIFDIIIFLRPFIISFFFIK